MKSLEIKHKIKNLGNFKTLKEIKKAGLRVVKNTKTGDYWLVEKAFLKPVIKSPKESATIRVDVSNLQFKLLMCHEDDESELRNSYVIKYIKWGEKQGFNKRPSTKGRARWWDLGKRRDCLFIVPCSFSDTFKVFLNTGVLVDKRLYEGYCDSESVLLSLNAILFSLMMELGTRTGLGEGLLDVTVKEVQRVLIINPKLISKKARLPQRKINNVFEECGLNPKKEIRSQTPKPLPDRKELDKIVFDVLGLTKEEQNEVYWSLCELVKNRLQKAKSV